MANTSFMRFFIKKNQAIVDDESTMAGMGSQELIMRFFGMSKIRVWPSWGLVFLSRSELRVFLRCLFQWF
jgi:hypothetical protein